MFDRQLHDSVIDSMERIGENPFIVIDHDTASDSQK